MCYQFLCAKEDALRDPVDKCDGPITLTLVIDVASDLLIWSAAPLVGPRALGARVMWREAAAVNVLRDEL